MRRTRAKEKTVVLQPGHVTINDVAKLARVSVATVSRVLNGDRGKASAPTIARVAAAASQLRFQPAHHARALRTSETRLVAVLSPDITNVFCAAIADAIEASLAEQEYSMILCNTREDPKTQDILLAEMHGHRVRGVIMLGAVDSAGLTHAMARPPPIVFINRRPAQWNGVYIGVDNYAAARAVGDHFASQGLFPCAVLHGPSGFSASEDRLKGFKDGIISRGIAIDEQYLIETELTMTGGYENAVRLLNASNRPRAVFCGNDQIAYGVFRRCQELSISVPQDMALFGFDDNPLNEWLAPWLSTVHVPYADFGPAVSRALRGLMRGAITAERSEILFPFSLSLRHSA